MYKSPQIFHNKQNGEDCIIYPSILFEAINNLLSKNEAAVMLTWLGSKGNEPFSPNISYMLKMTGIKSPENYYRIKRKLIKEGYAEERDSDIYIDTNKIIARYEEGRT